MQKEPSGLTIEKSQKDLIPTGFREILVKQILPYAVERKLKFHSKKYNKLDYPYAVSQKPISKIVTCKAPQDESEN